MGKNRRKRKSMSGEGNGFGVRSLGQILLLNHLEEGGLNPNQTINYVMQASGTISRWAKRYYSELPGQCLCLFP